MNQFLGDTFFFLKEKSGGTIHSRLYQKRQKDSIYMDVSPTVTARCHGLPVERESEQLQTRGMGDKGVGEHHWD